jgi:hypothetical protein
VRVVDSLIFPVSFSAHVRHSTLCCVLILGIVAHGAAYVFAEKAASIILAGPSPSGTSSGSSGGIGTARGLDVCIALSLRSARPGHPRVTTAAFWAVLLARLNLDPILGVRSGLTAEGLNCCIPPNPKAQ